MADAVVLDTSACFALLEDEAGTPAPATEDGSGRSTNSMNGSER